MKNKSIGISYILIFFFIGSVSQVYSQTKVIRANAVKSNDYGVQYFLPKTILEIDIEYTETKQKAGPYARYAARYLGVNDSEVVTDDKTVYSFNKISVSEIGIPNKHQSYLVAFKSKTTAPFVYLTEEGVICSINAEYTPENNPKQTVNVHHSNTASGVSSINPQSLYTEEYLHAGSISKMAEVAAKNIYRIRESRQDILTGETDNVPKDGEAIKLILDKLDAQEKSWTGLFLGTKEVTVKNKRFTLEPDDEIEKEILFRFSKYLGIVDADDLSGSPFYLNLKNLHTVEIPTDDPKAKKKEAESIVYNVPGKAQLEIFTDKKKVYSETINITQFGITRILETAVFEDKKAPVKILFYPHLGAIRQIIQ